MQQGKTPTAAVTEAAREKMERAVGRIIDQARRAPGRGEACQAAHSTSCPVACGGLKCARDTELLLNTLLHFNPQAHVQWVAAWGILFPSPFPAPLPSK